ncbi:MAG: Holliday junction branch migration protein RuvA [Maricaulaceae bacterium]
MIGYLEGVVRGIGAAEALIVAGGVGYVVQAGARTLAGLQVGEPAALHVETVVRETAISLFGFASDEDRAWFVRLQDIQGVGARVALAVLDVLGPADLMRAAQLEDKAAVARAQGVGPRLAQRIVTELKDKPSPQGRSLSGTGALAREAPAPITATPNAVNPRADAVSALVNLGFGLADAERAASEALAQAGDDAETGALVRLALKVLGG